MAIEGNAEMTAMTIRCSKVLAIVYMAKVPARMQAPTEMTDS